MSLRKSLHGLYVNLYPHQFPLRNNISSSPNFHLTRSFSYDTRSTRENVFTTPHLSNGLTVQPVQEGILRLYSIKFCPFAQRALLVVEAKGIPYDVVNCNLKEPDWLVERNPGGKVKVPILETKDGKVIYDSLVVSEYLHEIFPSIPKISHSLTQEFICTNSTLSIPKMWPIPSLALFGITKILRWVGRRNWNTVDKSNEINVQGKTVLITGANTGIGKTTALEFADRGAQVILACRNDEKANNAVKWIRQKSRNGELICMKLDLSSLHSIRQFCHDFKTKYDKLHILVNNAGVINSTKDRMTTQDGFEIHMGVNHLGHFLLTNLLLDLLKQSTPSRIVTVSSIAHKFGKLNFNDLMHEKTEPPFSIPLLPRLYCNSKLANALFNKELAKRLEGSGVTCYALCPGLVETDITRDARGITLLMYRLAGALAKFVGLKTPEEGAQTTVYCALNKQISNQSGEMYQHCEYWSPESRVLLKDEDAKKLWEESEKLVGLNQS